MCFAHLYDYNTKFSEEKANDMTMMKNDVKTYDTWAVHVNN